MVFVVILVGLALGSFLEIGVGEGREQLQEFFVVGPTGIGLLFKGEDDCTKEGGDGEVAIGGRTACVLVEPVRELDGEVAHGLILWVRFGWKKEGPIP
jgi:hypothetical protein